METLCEACGGPDPDFRCSECKVARFCGPACFRGAWASHKAVCSAKMPGIKENGLQNGGSRSSRPWPSPGEDLRVRINGRIAFIDFWPGFEDNTDRWFCKDWFRKNLKGVEIVEPHECPDVVMCSLFGRSRLRYLQYGSTAKLVFFTGENARPPVGRIPLCISFDRIEDVPATMHTRIPLWVFNKEVHRVIQLHEARLRNNVNSAVRKRAGFCSWVASNATMYNAEFRTRFVQILSNRYKQVDCGGEVMNNVGGPVKDKMEFLRGYRFNVCFENTSHPGYCTEKLLHAFASECIPIYWGDPACSCNEGGGGDFNPKALISAHDFENTFQLIQHIERVDKDAALFESYLKQPILADHWYHRLKDWSGFCSGLKDLLFAECHQGTQRAAAGTVPAPMGGYAVVSACAQEEGTY